MRESRLRGSVRGAVSNDRPYRDNGAYGVAVVAFIGDQHTHGRCFRQHIWCGRDAGILARRQMQDNLAALRIGQSVDSGHTSAAADGLRVFPPFAPEALR